MVVHFQLLIEIKKILNSTPCLMIERKIITNQWFKFSLIYLLLAGYTILGVIGHLELLNIFGFGIKKQTTGTVCWTHDKHIPPDIKITVLSPAILPSLESPYSPTYRVLLAPSTFNNYHDPGRTLHSSRAPPRI
jgi:hypothetical protein